MDEHGRGGHNNKQKGRAPHHEDRICCARLRERKSQDANWIKNQKEYDWKTVNEYVLRFSTDAARSLDTLTGTSIGNIFMQLALAFSFGFYVGAASAVALMWERVIHYFWQDLNIADHSNPYYYFHWMWAASVSGGIIIYVIKTYIPECVGGGFDNSKVSMAMRAPTRASPYQLCYHLVRTRKTAPS